MWEAIFGDLVIIGNLLPQYFFADAPPETDIEDSLLQRDEYIYELQV